MGIGKRIRSYVIEFLAERELDEMDARFHNEKIINADIGGPLRRSTEERLRELRTGYGDLFRTLIKTAAAKMEQDVLATYIPNDVILELGLPIMARADKQLERAPIAVVSRGREVYRTVNFSRRCSLDDVGLCHLVRSVTMGDGFDTSEEYEVSRERCDLFVSALPSSYASSIDSGSYLVRMVPLGAGRTMFGNAGEAAARRVRRAVEDIITLNGVNIGGEHATE